ncbi:MAG: UPF0182 family protein [Spirochaetes bacterium]|jgi:uncharacterized membrane protein (UPF0182 family)|nr:UPF0182 family protein [Spirochaetota bacterium]
MKKINIILAVTAIVLLYTVLSMSSLITDYLWFDHYGQLKTFFTLFITRFAVKGIFALIFLTLLVLNTFIVIFLSGGGRTASIPFLRLLPPSLQKKKYIIGALILVFIFLSYVMGSAAQPFWTDILKYLNQTPFSNYPADPIFNRELSFYLFSLPFYNFIHGWIIGALVVISILSIVFHIMTGAFSMRTGKVEVSPAARSHLSIMGSLFMLSVAVGYYLSAFDILFSQRGKFYGAGYTAVNSQLFAYRICMILAIIAAVLLAVNVFRRSIKLATISVAATFILFIILGSIIPSMQQRFVVEPNELEKEREYINNNITFTRLAYGLSDIQIAEFQNDGELSVEDIRDNKDVISNIRLWDWRPLQQTYRQIQELRPYYSFMDVDVDRYVIGGSLSAVNVAGRELLTRQLSPNSQTWVNTHLVYTHGYGVVMNRVDRITPEGMPELIIKDIPPQSDHFEIDQPQIYYGEHDNDYILTNTGINPGEFDYPSGESNSYTTYDGLGGIKLDSIFKRLMYALTFSDINILISNNILPQTRIHYNRNIKELASKLAPFIIQDTDPYIVISEGQLYYIMDAYTLTDQFPYSTPLKNRRINYIRNSVKIVVNAYDGDIKYYISDISDPIIQTYASIFPDLFSDFSEMPAGIKQHIRYPETLFDVQAEILLRYHMTDANVFYNNEDAWDIPNQIYDSSEQKMESYYIITRLPGEDSTEFVLMVPFTPIQKSNMVSFMVAQCDNDNYGKMTLYKLPKDKLNYGPMQLEARINQDANISKQLSLWSQKGSRVIRGNMLAIPIKESLLFVEPLYLKAESSEMPELKRVIVCFRDKIVMEENLPDALARIFGLTERSTDEKDESSRGKASPVSKLPDSIKNLTQEAYKVYTNATEQLKSGDFEAYGNSITELGKLLQKLNEYGEK